MGGDIAMRVRTKLPRQMLRMRECILGVALLGCSALGAQRALTEEQQDLLELPLESLMKLTVTSVSRRSQDVQHTPASVYVISAAEIKRSTARNIPDILRGVPGVQVASVAADKWSISIRGFNDLFSNKLLLLIDGVSVYTPSFSGVYWSQEQLPLEEIERIEIIRGPGASMWGSNAVNGVINIISKKATPASGGSVSVGGGYPHQFEGYAGRSFSLGTDTNVRLFLHGTRDHDFRAGAEGEPNDGWGLLNGGFRLDSKITQTDKLSAQLHAYDAHTGSRIRAVDASTLLPINPATTDRGSGVRGLVSWHHDFSTRSQLDLEGSYYGTRRKDFGIHTNINQYDLQVHHDYWVWSNLKLLSGAGYRITDDDVAGDRAIGISFDESYRHIRIFNSFVQGDLTILPDELTFSAGTKVENHTFTGWNVQPNVRVGYTPAQDHFIWGAISYAERVPSRAIRDADFLLPAAPLADATSGLQPVNELRGSEAIKNEEVLSYEVGYRDTVIPQVTLDVVGFYMRYSDLVGNSIEPPELVLSPRPFLAVPLPNANNLEGYSAGVEFAAQWEAHRGLKFFGTYSFLRMGINESDPQIVTVPSMEEKYAPQHQFSLGFNARPFEKLVWDTRLNYTDEIEGRGIDSYFRLDTRLTYQLTPAWSVSIVGQNLIEDVHEEFAGTFFVSSNRVPRGVFGWTEYRF